MPKEYMVEFTFTEAEMEEFLRFGEKKLSDVSQFDMGRILSNMSKNIKSIMLDEPHYVYEDHIEDIVNENT